MAIKALLFDVHRTLVNDSGFPRERIRPLIRAAGGSVALQTYYRRYDELVRQLFNWPEIQPFITIREIHRKRLQILYREFGVARDIDTDLNYLWKCMETSRIYPEVPALLEQLKQKYKLALVSNADSDDPLIKILLKNNFKLDIITTSEALRCYKPDRILFDYTLQQLNCLPEEVIMVGDSLISDIQGARNAGIKSVWLNRTRQKREHTLPLPDFEINKLDEIFVILESADRIRLSAL